MFANLSNLKDKLNTSLQNINQAGYITTPTTAAAAAAAGGDLSPPTSTSSPSSPPISPTSSPRTGRRIAPSPLSNNNEPAAGGLPGGDSGLPQNVEEKLEKLARYESRFPELAKAYKHLLKQFKAAEGVLKAEAPNVDGLADSDALQAHLRNMNMKSQFAMEEIKRLTEALDEQKQQIEELRSIHSDASKSQADMLYSLKAEVKQKDKEIEELRTKPESTSREATNRGGAIFAEEGLTDPLGASRRSPRSRSLSPARRSISSPRATPSLLKPIEDDTQNTTLIKSLEEQLRNAQNAARDDALQMSNLVAENTALKAMIEDSSDRKVDNRIPDMEKDGDFHVIRGKRLRQLADETEESAIALARDLETKIQEAQEAAQKSELKCAELNEQVQVLSVKNEELVLEISRGEELVSQMKEQLESLTEKDKNLRQQQLSDAEIEFKAKIDESQGENAARIQTLNESLDRMTQEKSLLVERLNELTSEVTRRVAEQEEAKIVHDLQIAELGLLRTELEQKVKENDQILKELEASHGDIKKSSEKIVDLESKVQTMTGSIREHDVEMRRAQEEVDASSERIKALESQVQELTGSIQQKDSQMSLAKSEAENSIAKLEQDAKTVLEHELRLHEEAKARELEQVREEWEGNATKMIAECGLLREKNFRLEGSIREVEKREQDLILRVSGENGPVRVAQLEALGDQLKSPDSLVTPVAGGSNNSSMIEHLTDQITMLRTRIYEFEIEIESLRSQVSESDSVKADLQADLNVKQNEVDGLKLKVKQLETLMEEGAEKAESTRREMEANTKEREALEGQLRTLTENAEEFRVRFEALEKEKNALDENVAKSCEENGSMEGRLRSVLEAHQITKDQLTAVGREKDEAIEKSKLLAEMKKTLDERLDAVSADKQSLELEKTGLEDELKMVKASHADAIQEIQEEKAKLAKDIKDTEQRLAESEAVLSAARKELENFEIEHRQKEGNVADVEEEARKLKLEHEAMVTERNQAMTQLETMKEQISKDRKSHNELQKELDKARSTIANMSGEIQSEKGAIQTLQRSEKELRDKIEKVTKEKERFASLNSDNAQKIRTLESSISEQKESLSTLQVELSQKIGLVEQLRSQQTEDEEAKNKSVSLLKKARKHHVKLEKERDDAVSELAQVKSRLVELEAAQTTLLSSLTTLREQQNVREQEYKEALGSRDHQLNEITRRFNDFQSQTQRVSSERAQLSETLSLKQVEFDSSQQALEESRYRESEAQRNAIEASDRAGVLEEELQTSKALFERIAKQYDELRGKLSESEQAVVGAEGRTRDTERKLAEWEARHEQVVQMLEQKLEALKSNVVDLTKQKEGYAGEVQRLKEECKVNQTGKDEARNRQEELEERLKLVEQQLVEAKAKSSDLRDLEEAIEKAKGENEQVLEENRMREGHLRAMNKTLKDEIRKLQKQTSSSNVQPSQPLLSSSGGASPPVSPPVSRRRSSSPRSVSSGFGGGRKRVSIEDADVNVEYLRHVVLKFVEMKDQRPQLLSVLGTILDFSPEELRRVSRKV